MNAFECERQIRALGAAIEACSDRTEQRLLFARMASLIRARSPQTVTTMEAARGLLTVQIASVHRGQ
jgi:hypothetical protein